jgi:hypothetical protein
MQPEAPIPPPQELPCASDIASLLDEKEKQMRDEEKRTEERNCQLFLNNTLDQINDQLMDPRSCIYGSSGFGVYLDSRPGPSSLSSSFNIRLLNENYFPKYTTSLKKKGVHF